METQSKKQRQIESNRSYLKMQMRFKSTTDRKQKNADRDFCKTHFGPEITPQQEIKINETIKNAKLIMKYELGKQIEKN